MATSPNWISVSLQLGYPKPGPGYVDSGKLNDAGTLLGPSIPIGTIAQYRDIGTSQLGCGEFIYLPGVTSTVAGDWVTYITSDGSGAGVNKGGATTRWAGTANTGYPLAVATAAVATSSNYGWYQIQGAAICNVSGNISAGDKMYFAQTATVGNTATAGKQVLNAQASSAQGVPDTGKVVVTLDRPFVQGQIT